MKSDANRPAPGRGQRIRWRVESAGWIAFETIAGRVPEPIGRALGSLAGALAFLVDGRHRAVALDNLEHAFGRQLTSADRRKLARTVFQGLGRNLAEVVRSRNRTNLDLRDRFEIVNADAVRAALNFHGQIVIVTTHTGNWELSGTALARLGVEGTVVVKPLKNPYLDARLTRWRRVAGFRTIVKSDSMRGLVRELREGRSVAIAVDQSVRSNHVFVRFFGRECAAPRSIGVLCTRFGIPAVTVCTARIGTSGRHLIEFGEPIMPRARADRRTEERRIVQVATGFLEDFVRRHPGDWLWLHRRWKSQPPADEAPRA